MALKKERQTSKLAEDGCVRISRLATKPLKNE
jgi:hypothetical protein